ncbi:sensor histidine kinase [Paenibacillus sp.]|uniref:cache domain-containing sensor histidine kinase n=1 Tax=Paenibacillus sp. TaxID=58172 RepID=UPI002D6B611C|nr:sensor histidine kinase [Paenibacillus sp.]HZG57438.1 sensor histidine kinase [Paenibacillus sp.]
MKIRTKLILTNVFIVLAVLGSLTYAFLKRSTDLVFETIHENNKLSLSQVASNLDSKLRSYEEIANALFLNTALDAAATKVYTDDREAYEMYFEYYQPFVSAVQISKDIFHFHQYTDNPTFRFANVFLIDEAVRQSEWYRQTMETRNGGIWTKPYDTPGEAVPVFSFRKRLNNFDRASARVVSLEIKLNVLYDLVNEESKSKRFLFLLPNGDVLLDSARSEGEIGGGVERSGSDVESDAEPTEAIGGYETLDQLPFAEQLSKAPSGSFTYRNANDTYQIFYQTLDSRNTVRGMKVVSYVPLTEIMPRIDQLKSLAVALLAVAFIVSVLLISLFSVGLTRRLSELSGKMRSLNRDNFESYVVVKGKDEVAQLGEMFNMMVRRLRELIREVYQSELDRREHELRTKEVELYALQTQINPHFLFNVLNMIRGKLLISGERENAKVVGLLAKSFRMMLKKGGQTIPLAEELEFVDIYLQIQQYRFGDKFSYSIELEDDAFRGVYVPKLCIQPLAENALSHGVELSPERSHIRIRCAADDGRLRVVVSDDGLGMTPGRLEEVRGWLREADSLDADEHIGLRNVHLRLRQLYGEGFGLEIESAAGAGTVVTMTIPMQEREMRRKGEERHA